MSAANEAQVRKALRWYPSNWRERNEDALLGIVLDTAEDRGGIARADLWHLRASGLAHRLMPLISILPSAVRDRAASAALGFGLAIAVVMLVIQEWAPWATSGAGWGEPYPGAAVGPFGGWGGVLYSAWIIAAIAIVCRAVNVGRVILFATAPLSFVLVLVVANDHWLRPSTSTLLTLALLAVTVALGKPFAFRWSALPFMAALAFGIQWAFLPIYRNVDLTHRLEPRMAWEMFAGHNGGGNLVFVFGALAAAAIILRQRAWFGAVCLLFIPWLANLGGRLWFNEFASDRPALALLAAVILALVAIVVIAASRYQLQIVRRR